MTRMQRINADLISYNQSKSAQICLIRVIRVPVELETCNLQRL